MQFATRSDHASLAAQLRAGISELELSIGEKQQRLLLDFLLQLEKWNQAYNLSGISEAGSMVKLHLLDSLSILPFIHGRRILDVGTGAGLPGIPLAICCPDKKFTLLDSNGKKTRFLFQACALLQIGNTEQIQERAENYQSKEPFDIVVSRAFSSVQEFIEKTRHLLAPEGRILAMKGQFPEAEMHALPEGFILQESHALKIPGEPGERHLLELTRQ